MAILSACLLNGRGNVESGSAGGGFAGGGFAGGDPVLCKSFRQCAFNDAGKVIVLTHLRDKLVDLNAYRFSHLTTFNPSNLPPISCSTRASFLMRALSIGSMKFVALT